MSTNPILLWSSDGTPNPWKVAIILEELGVPYEMKNISMADMKKEPYEAINPNGRVPAIQDQNTGITVWESAACIDYLLDTYDTTGSLVPTDAQAKWFARSWRDFQISGQGPYSGQLAWFTRYHPEKIQSAIDRYANEAVRIIGVIDRHLGKTKTQYLTGNKLTYADLMWAPYYFHLDFFLPKGTVVEDRFPHFGEWWERVSGHPSVKKIRQDREAVMAATGR